MRYHETTGPFGEDWGTLEGGLEWTRAPLWSPGGGYALPKGAAGKLEFLQAPILPHLCPACINYLQQGLNGRAILFVHVSEPR